MYVHILSRVTSAVLVCASFALQALPESLQGGQRKERRKKNHHKQTVEDSDWKVNSHAEKGCKGEKEGMKNREREGGWKES